jgi:hypothetical protein
MSEQQTTEALAACECGHPVIDHYGGCDFCSCRFTHEMALNAHVERIVAARLAYPDRSDMNGPAAHEFERRASIARDHEGNIVGYYFDADLWREVRARLAAVEAYRQRCAITRTEPTLAGLTTALRAVVAADPAEWSCRDCGATGSLSDSVTHRCVVAAVVADPTDTGR